MEIGVAIREAQRRIEADGPFCSGSVEQTKVSLVVPLLHDVFGVPIDARHLRVEYEVSDDLHTDYAVVSDEGDITLLVECKAFGQADKPIVNLDEVRRLFDASECDMVCLTDGRLCHFWTDMLRPHVMDDEPCYTLDIAEPEPCDFWFAAQAERHILDREDFRIFVCQHGRVQVISRQIASHCRQVLEAAGIDMSDTTRGEEWNHVMMEFTKAAETEMRRRMGRKRTGELLEERLQPSAISTMCEVGEATTRRSLRTMFSYTPSEMDLNQGCIYRICRQKWQGDAPYDGFVWFPESTPKGVCYILPGTRIKQEVTEAFRNDPRNSVVLSYRDFTLQKTDGIVTHVTRSATPSTATRFITGSCSFPKTPKEEISAERYLDIVTLIGYANEADGTDDSDGTGTIEIKHC